MTPARRCRLENYKSGRYFLRPDLIPDDFDFEYHERKLYELSLEIQKTESEELKFDPNRTKAGIFMASIGLFCYGHLEVVDDIIEYFKLVPRPIKTMVWVLRELLPLPQEIGIDNPDLLKQWLFDNRNRLEWSEEKGKYLLVN
jgi:hypothetical protein